jgi:predicted DsbA family dithiol-disulfide isomerase
VGKHLVQKALDEFHRDHTDVRVELRVTRRPYSWAGDDRTVEQGKIRYGGEEFNKDKGYDEQGEQMRRKWRRENLEGYSEGPRSSEVPRTPMNVLGELASIDFNTAKEMKWHPVDSQRMILWAGQFGKQEEFAEAISSRHFEHGQTNDDTETILAAVADVPGLDVHAAAAFLATDEMVDYVWQSYGAMIKHFGITEIPVFVFNRLDGPSAFSPSYIQDVTPAPYIIVGSASVEIFSQVFEHILEETLEAQEQDDALREQYLGQVVGLQDGRQGKVIDVELGGALILETSDGKLVRQRTRAPPPPRGENLAPGPRAANL